MMRSKCSVARLIVPTDSEHLPATGGKGRVLVAKATGLSCTDGRLILGVKKQDHGPFFEACLQVKAGTRVVKELKIRGLLTFQQTRHA